MNNENKEMAFALRKEGKSYNEIRRTLNISKSTLSDWLKNDPVSQGTASQLAIAARRINGKKLAAFMKDKWEAYRAEAVVEAIKEFEMLSNDPLFVTGLMLYWGEGNKTPRGQLRITNADPRMIALFIVFLKKIMKIPEDSIRIELILYPDLSDEDCKTFWSEYINLPIENFIKSQYITGRHPTRRLPRGICMIYVSDIYQKTKLLTWIDIFARQYIIKPSE